MAKILKIDISKTKYSREYTRFYEAYNTLYFNGRLPKIKVRIGRLLDTNGNPTYGWTGFSPKNKRAVCIVLNQELKKWRCTHLITLLHEMCHVSLGMLEDDHGKIFLAETRRIIAEGALDDLL